MRTKKAVPFKTEVELCAAFSDCAKEHGWIVYPETAEWDLLLVGPEGVQLGIQAKLRFNATLLRQALPGRCELENPGPDYRGILLPECDRDIRQVCEAVGLICFSAEYAWTWTGEKDRSTVSFPRSKFMTCRYSDEGLRYWNPVSRYALPRYIPDVAGGQSAPVRLTEWKICALRVCAELEIKGDITAKRIRELGCNSARWTQAYDWIRPHPDKKGYWIAGPKLRFPIQHPTVYAEILAEMKAI